MSGLTEPLQIPRPGSTTPPHPHVSIATGNALVISCPSACLSDCGRDLSISATLTTAQSLVLSQTDLMAACTEDGRPGAPSHWKWTGWSRHTQTIHWLMVSFLVGTSSSPGPSLLKGWKSLWFLETGVILSQKVTGSFFTKNQGNTSQPLLHGYSGMNKSRHREHPV